MLPHQIIAYRADKGLSQAALAKLLKVSQSTVARLETGTVPRATLAVKLARLIPSKPRRNGKASA